MSTSACYRVLMMAHVKFTSFVECEDILTYSKAKLKSSGDRASPCFKPFLIGNLSDTECDDI